MPLAIVAVVLLSTMDDRHVGRAADERQIVWTAVAIAETGQWSQARGRDFTFVTSEGRSVSRFGMGMSLLQVPAALAAPFVERALGPGASQPLFLMVPFGLVLLSAALAGRAAALLGAGPLGSQVAIVLCGLGSPLGSYAATSFSEPLQAAALAWAYAAALASVKTCDRSTSDRLAVVSGVAVSVALLAKSSLLVVAPAALLPLLIDAAPSTRGRRVRRAAVGVLPGAAAWAAFEVLRFRGLFGSYPGEGFTNPIGDGLWRLLVGPNAGILLFFPAIVVACWAVGRRAAARAWQDLMLRGGAVVPFVSLLMLAAGWWAWHGVWGWGPRLLVPAIPLLAAVAAAGMVGWRPASQWAFVAVSIAINVPGLLQHPVPVTNYMANLVWPAASPEVARTFPGYAVRTDPDATIHTSPDHALARVPQASPLIVYPWFWWVTRTSDAAEAAASLDRPPWREARPDLVPIERPMGETFLRKITGQPRWTFWARGFVPSTADAIYSAVFDEGLADQVVRLQQGGDVEGAMRLARRLVDLAPIGCHDGLVFESYRLGRDREGAKAYLAALPIERRDCPDINVVLALFERDAGNAEMARQALESVADRYPPASPVHKAITDSLDRWPADLQSMMATPIKVVGAQ